MKTLFYLLLPVLFFLHFGTSGFAQTMCDNGTLQDPCNPVIPSDVVIINSETEITNANAICYWVCEGTTLFLNGVANCQAYGEVGSTIRLLGGENYIWMLGGGEVVVDPGAQFNWVRRVSNTILVDNGNLTMDSICNPLTYDRPVDLPNSCVITSIESPPVSQNELELAPNPADKEVFVKIPLLKNEKVEMYLTDIEGRRVFGQTIFWEQGGKYLNLNWLNEGLYIITIQNQKINYSGKILVAH